MAGNLTQRNPEKAWGGEETKTTYTYAKTWSASAIDSGNFRVPEEHQNPATMPYESSTQVADAVSLEKFSLPSSLTERIEKTQPLFIQATDIKNTQLPQGVQLHEGGFYSGTNPATPQIGDQRITFEVVKPMEVSVIAKQVQNTLEPYTTSNGGTIELLEIGTHSADAMITHAQEDNAMMTWVLRLVGFILLVIGINMVFKVLSVIADVLPLVGDIVGAGTGIIAFLIAMIFALITIAVAWIFYRPLLAAVLLTTVVGLFIAVKLKLGKRAKTPV
ncbi:TMEM43 family protein [Candidatus Thiothrix anitrata]|uniref:TMEM43 family protein n=1 Tax=Candidatus Thiothrix anitrata TaxID=2823902 RepID=A0ABX7WYU3_9GAMM|nr:TMEM43 family protein [Candidatus Thiothrix anitrata]QTR48911.1 TMEM43 family protein [Candidatus Thiothrix anitrata]